MGENFRFFFYFITNQKLFLLVPQKREKKYVIFCHQRGNQGKCQTFYYFEGFCVKGSLKKKSVTFVTLGGTYNRKEWD